MPCVGDLQPPCAQRERPPSLSLFFSPLLALYLSLTPHPSLSPSFPPLSFPPCFLSLPTLPLSPVRAGGASKRGRAQGVDTSRAGTGGASKGAGAGAGAGVGAGSGTGTEASPRPPRERDGLPVASPLVSIRAIFFLPNTTQIHPSLLRLAPSPRPPPPPSPSRGEEAAVGPALPLLLFSERGPTRALRRSFPARALLSSFPAQALGHPPSTATAKENPPPPRCPSDLIPPPPLPRPRGQGNLPHQ
uniref:Uncharacterized protein n=1 Tax=Ananas comosus var. bracteatus TaxID=296719 RepID=A0A6V7PIR8_ANACO|nr:unnamed protein product [Ananas comosus var. bracteatus]